MAPRIYAPRTFGTPIPPAPYVPQPGIPPPNQVDIHGIGPSYGNGPQRPPSRLPSGMSVGPVPTPGSRPSRPLRPPQPPNHPGGPTRPTEVASGWRSPATRAPEPMPRDFRHEAVLLHPWLAGMPELLDAYTQGFITYGDAVLAMAAMRESPYYDRYFAGNRRPDGSFRLTEQEYFSTRDGYYGATADFGINPSLLDARFVELIEGDVSVAEYQGRLRSLYNGIFNAGPVVSEGVSAAQRYYADTYGVEMSREALFLSFIDPDVGQDILDRRISVSQVGGGAFAFGYQRSRQRVEELMGLGLDTLDESVNFYRGVQGRQPNDNAIARRHNDPFGDVGVETYENAYLAGGWADQQRLSRNLQSELATFNRRGASQTDRAGLAFGLADR